MSRYRRRTRNARVRVAREHAIAIPGWVEYGGRLIFAVDLTSGGVPIGLEADEPLEESTDALEGEDGIKERDEALSGDRGPARGDGTMTNPY